MSVPPGTEMFQFPGFASPHYEFMQRYPKGVGCPIRIPTDQRLLAAPRGFSQRATSFIASWCQGIHRMPLSRSISRPRPRGREMPTMHRSHPHRDSMEAAEHARPQHAQPTERMGRTAPLSTQHASERTPWGKDDPSRDHPVSNHPTARPETHQNLIHNNKRPMRRNPKVRRPTAPGQRRLPRRRDRCRNAFLLCDETTEPGAPGRRADPRRGPAPMHDRREWRRPGSNRRPPACKAGALPAELRPRRQWWAREDSNLRPHAYQAIGRLSGARSNQLSCVDRQRATVGQGGLEPPTPRLSSVCSNQLSY